MTASLGNTIDLMDQNRQGPLIVQAGESRNVRGQLRHQLDALFECLRRPEGRAGELCRLRYRDDLKPAGIAKRLGTAPDAVS